MYGGKEKGGGRGKSRLEGLRGEKEVFRSGKAKRGGGAILKFFWAGREWGGMPALQQGMNRESRRKTGKGVYFLTL